MAPYDWDVRAKATFMTRVATRLNLDTGRAISDVRFACRVVDDVARNDPRLAAYRQDYTWSSPSPSERCLATVTQQPLTRAALKDLRALGHLLPSLMQRGDGGGGGSSK
jgi:hypothetical protein